MDLLSRIASWLGENDSTIGAVVGIAVLAGIVFAGVPSLIRRRAGTSPDKVPGAGAAEPSAATDSPLPKPDSLTVPGLGGPPGPRKGRSNSFSPRRRCLQTLLSVYKATRILFWNSTRLTHE